jgi:hypothetical protein
VFPATVLFIYLMASMCHVSYLAAYKCL